LARINKSQGLVRLVTLSRVLFLSNGHGEDLSGSLLAEELKEKGYLVDALPLVGTGSFYSKKGIRIIGKTQVFRTGGIGYTSLKGRLMEIFEGQFIYLLKMLFRLMLLRRNYDLLVVVGDVVPVFAAWLSSIPTIVYLVAYSSHYEGSLRLPWPARQCLANDRFLRIYSRDQLTAEDLSKQLRKKVTFLGNPFMDDVLVKRAPLPIYKRRLALLPGSRRPELEDNISLLLKVVSCFPSRLFIDNEFTIAMPLVNSLDDLVLAEIAEKEGWILRITDDLSSPNQLIKGKYQINTYRNCFVQVIQSSDLSLAMAGTATEQVVGLAKPVVQFPGNGPQFTSSFAEAQRRLLGPTVFCVNGKSNDKLIFHKTSKLITDLMDRYQLDPSFVRECNYQANIRLGNKGGIERIVNDIELFI